MRQFNKPINSSRQRLIGDMTLRRLSEETQIQYIRAVQSPRSSSVR